MINAKNASAPLSAPNHIRGTLAAIGLAKKKGDNKWTKLNSKKNA